MANLMDMETTRTQGQQASDPRIRREATALTGYWAECSTRASMPDDVLMPVFSFGAVSAVETVRWVHRVVRELAAAWNAEECARVMRRLYGSACGPELADLVDGLPFDFTVDCGRARVVWTVRRVWFLPLADRSWRASRPCGWRLARMSSEVGRWSGGCGGF